MVFGCSFSYGQALPDCHIEPRTPGPNPSEFSWVNLLGKDMGLEVVNLSHPGSSNLRILNTILNSEIRQDDLVIVQWSFMQRSLLFMQDKLQDIGSWVEKNITQKFYSVHDIDDLYYQTLLHIHHADLYLKEICNNTHHFVISYDEAHRRLLKNKPMWFNVKYNPINFYFVKKDKALDTTHPGLINHQIAAKYIKSQILKEKHDR